ncbi:MAG: FAD-binding protein [Chitinivibrionales bacterium]|nr:FAD-binding protein [Chitinivibrionales bacterium]MBD3397029.1 FAD-binding protein [Chitinivibrionales bacterium]
MKIIEGMEAVREQCADLLYDESRFVSGTPCAVYYPESTGDVREIVKKASDTKTPLTLIGGQTGITGGSVPVQGCIAICMASMHRILSAGKHGDGTVLLRCQPGITLEAIETFLNEPGSHEYPVEGTGILGPGAWMYPPDPTEMTAQLGGTVATNASGARSFWFGPTRNHVEAIQVVLANGDSLALKRGETMFQGDTCSFRSDQGAPFILPAMTFQPPKGKNAAGYFCADHMDLVDLFIGSEGTLGVLTEITVRLTTRPDIVAGLSFFPSRDSAFDFARFLRDDTSVIAIEYFDTTALGFIRSHKDDVKLKIPDLPPDGRAAVYWEYTQAHEASFEEVMDAWEEKLTAGGSSFETTWSGFEEQEMGRLKAFRHAVPELINLQIAALRQLSPSIRKVGTDAAVPRDHFESFFKYSLQLIESKGIEVVVFGHLGDCHLHFNMIPKTDAELSSSLEIYRQIMDKAVGAGGTVSAEHGIGKIKTDYLKLMYGETALEEMKRMKRALDPERLLNPGNLFEDP